MRHWNAKGSSNSASGYTSEGQSRDVNRYLHTYIHSCLTHNSQKIDSPTPNPWADKQHVVYRQTFFHCASQTMHFVQTESLGQTCFEPVSQHHFFNCICSLHISCWKFTILNFFNYHYCYGNLWSLMLNYCKLLWGSINHTCKMENLTDKHCMCSDHFTDLSSTLRSELRFPETQQYWNQANE